MDVHLMGIFLPMQRHLTTITISRGDPFWNNVRSSCEGKTQYREWNGLILMWSQYTTTEVKNIVNHHLRPFPML